MSLTRVEWLAGKNLAQHRLEMADRPGRVIRVKGHLVPVTAEDFAAVEPFMAAIPLALILVHAAGRPLITHP